MLVAFGIINFGLSLIKVIQFGLILGGSVSPISKGWIEYFLVLSFIPLLISAVNLIFSLTLFEKKNPMVLVTANFVILAINIFWIVISRNV